MRTIILIIGVIAFGFSGAMAHNPLTAKFELNSEPEEGAVLSIYLSQVGLHQALERAYPAEDLNHLPVVDYKELAVRYLKENIHLVAGDTKLVLGEGGIRYGSHETDLMFLIPNFPAEADQLQLSLDCFRQLEGHHTVFWWNDGVARSKLILSANNDFQGTIDRSEKKVLSGSADRAHLNGPPFGWLLLALALVVAGWRINRKRVA